jgi:diacylglycerol kinase family enzyme
MLQIRAAADVIANAAARAHTGNELSSASAAALARRAPARSANRPAGMNGPAVGGGTLQASPSGRCSVGSLRTRRWCAWAAFALVGIAVAILLAFAGPRSLWLVLLTVGAVVVVVAAVYWFLLQRGPVRWLAFALAVGTPVAVLVVFAVDQLLLVAVGAAVALAAGVAAGHTALSPAPADWALPVTDAPAPRRPVLIMNPRSGGGKVGRFHLRERAEELGAEVLLLDRPGTDVQQLARDAIARGADLIGVAGGDGTQALVAQVAAEHGLPFLVVSAGTRNHFALDLGLDREDPARCLDALRDGVEARIDLGEVNGRPFVNNASFGAYAEIVENPAYRDDKRRTALDTLPDLLSHRRGAHLVAEADGVVVDAPQAVLVSNNPYEASDLAGLGRRARLDRGVLGMIAVRVGSTRQAVRLLNGVHREGLLRLEARQVLVTADVAEVPAGIDGETVRLACPVRCTVRPGALRVRLPRERPGVRPPKGRLHWAQLWHLALGRSPYTAGPAEPVLTPAVADPAPPRAGRDG